MSTLLDCESQFYPSSSRGSMKKPKRQSLVALFAYLLVCN